MRLATRTLLASALVALVAALGLGAIAHSRAIAYNAHVEMIDNDAAFRPAGNPGIGIWGFGPEHLSVTQGDQIVFDNPAGNKQSHTVTSLSWTGSSPYRSLDVGAKFDSSPTRDQAIAPGSSWSLDTSTLDPGQYDYYCSIHPWMVGSFTVTAPAGS
jgi:plastocyanin